MGPRSHERGNERREKREADSLRLQWGRVLMNAETLIASAPVDHRSRSFNGAAFS